MGGLIEMGDFFVQAIHCQGVLNEVIGAETEEFDTAGERAGRQRSGRNLDHGADFDLRIKWHPFDFEFAFIFLNQLVCLEQLFQAGDHRIHELDVALDAGAQNRPELRPENGALLQTKSNRAPA